MHWKLNTFGQSHLVRREIREIENRHGLTGANRFISGDADAWGSRIVFMACDTVLGSSGSCAVKICPAS